MRLFPLALFLVGCGPSGIDVGAYAISFDGDGRFDIHHARLGSVLEQVELVYGVGSAEVDMQFGAFRFQDEQTQFVSGLKVGKIRGKHSPLPLVEIEDGSGTYRGTLQFGSGVNGALIIDWSPVDPMTSGSDSNVVSPLVGLSAACDTDDHFLGLGAHAQDIDHVGEAFSLWVQEPGIGKSETDDLPAGWPLEGAKHDTSFPVPALIRPHRGQGLVLNTSARIDVDLCATNPGRFDLLAWRDGPLQVVVVGSGSALGATQEVAKRSGLLTLPPPWVFGPWNDAIRGPDRVHEVADQLRASGASSTAIWTEDWKGGEENGLGYHLLGAWEVDETLYPEAEAVVADLRSQGFHWLAYFSPFLMEDTDEWQAAIDAGVMLEDAAGEPVVFSGATFKNTSMVDVTGTAGRAWAVERMTAALDLGFNGWMADFGEWLPLETDLAGGGDAFEQHNAFPLAWQETNAQAVAGTDAVFWVRSGWLGTSGSVPIVWAGDQRTDFSADDGFPSVLPMGLGLAASGVPVFAHDIAGYQSVGNDPSDRELWFRWASLGAYSPVMRTHHGAYDTENWQFDSDEATLAHWANVSREHSRLFPYLYGLAGQASADGTPMLLPIAYVYDAPWDRADAWLLGAGMLVAPVLERGVTGREVELPGEVGWFRWPDLTPASSGQFDAQQEEIPVFVAAGSTIPTFDTIPDTFVEGEDVDSALVSFTDADAERVVYLIGGGGPFVEGDGTSYVVSGSPNGSGEVTKTLTSGSVEVAGLSVTVTGEVSRRYTFVAVN
jgi:alpha-glucosidase (family GH31 glycosyl hydrolase)